MAILVELTATVKLELPSMVIAMADIPKPLPRINVHNFLECLTTDPFHSIGVICAAATCVAGSLRQPRHQHFAWWHSLTQQLHIMCSPSHQEEDQPISLQPIRTSEGVKQCLTSSADRMSFRAYILFRIS